MSKKKEKFGLRCPECGSPNLGVTDTRGAPAQSLRRRRECEDCGYRFTTYEKAKSSSAEEAARAKGYMKMRAVLVALKPAAELLEEYEKMERGDKKGE